MKYKISRHAQTEMERRNISQSLVESVLNAPGQLVLEKSTSQKLTLVVGKHSDCALS
ncbi:DUF4258 domain-containing protein [Nostoc sp. WHI]|uniref:DUF4258 domain-containing protein n=1 Tax=Nostoc sp. WHI TaxID=2650611 RepID=UPI0018C4F447|nr:DUF4258 domain-containing protein [Nostoc sp. WHI]